MRPVHVGEQLHRAFGPRPDAGGDLGHGCQVVIVVFRNEVAEIDQRHRLVEPWMSRNPREILRRHLREPRENRHSRSAKCGDQIAGDAIVVPRLVSPAVRQVCGVKRRRAAIEIVEPLIPERLEVEEMAGMLLNRPAAIRPVHPNVGRHPGEDGAGAIRGQGQPIQQRGGLGHRHTEHEGAIEPAFHAPKW